MGKFTFIYKADNSDLVKEFEVTEGVTTEQILEAFAAFLVLCGQAYDDESIN